MVRVRILVHSTEDNMTTPITMSLPQIWDDDKFIADMKKRLGSALIQIAAQEPDGTWKALYQAPNVEIEETWRQ
jgi:hypothetical protein